MSEIIWGTDIKPIKQVCKEHGIMCEFATELGYCKITGCDHNYDKKERGNKLNKYRLIGSWLFCNNQAINLQYVYEIYRDQNVLYFYYAETASQIKFDSVAEAENELYNILITMKDWDNTMMVKEKK